MLLFRLSAAEEGGCWKRVPRLLGFLELSLSDVAFEVEKVEEADVVDEGGSSGQLAGNIVDVSLLNGGVVVADVVAEVVVVNEALLVVDADEPRPFGIVVVEAGVVERVLVARAPGAPPRLDARLGSSGAVLLLVVGADMVPALPAAPVVRVARLVVKRVEMAERVVALREEHRLIYLIHLIKENRIKKIIK